MGIYIRKSIKVGPVKFNLSKSGIGASVGVTGLRVGTGPSGNFVHMGANGIYYRRTSGGGGKFSGRSSLGHNPHAGYRPPNIAGVPMTEIESGSVDQMVHSSSAELLMELNEKKKVLRVGSAALGAALVACFLVAVLWQNPVAFFITLCLAGIGVYFAYRHDSIRKTVVLIYEFDSVLERIYSQLHATVSRLSQCSNCWHVAASGRVHDKKYHAGASKLVDRKPTSIRIESPPFLKTNISTVAVDVGRQTLYFFPDRLFVFDSGKIGTVGYGDLSVHFSQGRFIEDVAPSDALIVGNTWQYVNKSGGPDRRFASNAQLPICLYDELHFSSKSGLNEIVQVSRAGLGKGVYEAILQLAHYGVELPS